MWSVSVFKSACRSRVPRFCIVLLIFALSGCGFFAEKKKIAISIDDAPLMRFHSHGSQGDRIALIDSLGAALERFKAPATVFVVGSQVDEPEEKELFVHWMGKGVSVGNHSFSHRAFNDMSREEGAEEIERTNALIRPAARAYGEEIRYFRFPFLAEGSTPEEKRQWREELERRGMRNAPVSISNDDWKFDAEYTEAELAQDWGRRYEIGQAYLQHMRESIAYWDALGQDLTERNIRHVLLIHANRINRDYLGQILAELDDAGFDFISLDAAYEDPVYDAEDEWTSNNGTSFLENIKQTRIRNGTFVSAR